jgi:spermidine synthase
LRSSRADIVVADLDCLGRTLFHNRLERLDEGAGEIEISELMHSEIEGYAYNELVTHIPLLSLEAPRRVMVLGGGSLYTAREVLKHPTVESVDVVDYDPAVTEFVIRNYDASQEEIRADPRVTVRCADVREFLDVASEGEYDAVIDDLIDLVRPEDRWVLNLYPNIARTLRGCGFFGTYLYPSWFHSQLNRLIVSALRLSGFRSIFVTDESVFTYSWPEGFTAYLIATPSDSMSAGELNRSLTENFERRALLTRQFRPSIHQIRPVREHPSFSRPRPPQAAGLPGETTRRPPLRPAQVTRYDGSTEMGVSK